MRSNVQSLALAQFREFYSQVISLRGVATQSHERRDSLPDEIRSSLTRTLEQQARNVPLSGEIMTAEVRRRAEYIQVTLADELFINLDWSGRSRWTAAPLEFTLFGSYEAGEEIFRRIDELVRDANPRDRELAPMYLLTLSLGFQGVWRGNPEGPRKLQEYRQRLFYLTYERDATLPANGHELVPQAYEHTLDRGQASHLSYLRPVYVAFAVVIALWLAASSLLWHSLISDFHASIKRINYQQPPAKSGREQGSRTPR